MAVRARSHALRPLACVASLHFACQGLIGLVLGVLSLCVCFCALGDTPDSTGNTVSQYLTYYLQGEECAGNDVQLYNEVTTPTAMRVWMCLSLFFSVSMTASSLVLFVAVTARWSDEKLQITLISWIIINSLVTIDDLILGSVFTNDFSQTLESSSSVDSQGILALGIVAFLSVRGIYLWLMNLAFIIYLAGRARHLHMYLNEQITRSNQLIESWPTLDEFGQTKNKEVADIDRTFTAVNHGLAKRGETSGSEAPQHSAMVRWPTMNGQPFSMDVETEHYSRQRRAKTMREPSLRRQNGVDNPGFQPDAKPYYLRLQSETGSTRDFGEFNSSASSAATTPKGYENRTPQQHWDLPRGQERRDETSHDFLFGQYFRRTPESHTQGAAGYTEENGVPIPPVDYLDPSPEREPEAGSSEQRLQSLQEAILDRTLRLKKVPEEIKKGINYN